MGTLVPTRMLARLRSFFPSTVTVQAPVVGRNSVGEEVIDWQDLPDHVGIRAVIAPIRQGWPPPMERQRVDKTVAIGTHHVVLQGHYPAITTRMRLVADGRSFEIRAVEHDSHGVLARLRVEEMS